MTEWLAFPACEIFNIKKTTLDKLEVETGIRSFFRRLTKPPAAELLAELLAGTVQHHPKIALGDIHSRADFPVRALFDFVKLKHLRNPRRQFAKREFQICAEFVQLHPPARQL